MEPHHLGGTGRSGLEHQPSAQPPRPRGVGLREREYLADGLKAVANVSVGALLIGQFLSDEFNWFRSSLGILIWIIFYALGLMLLRGSDEET